MSETTWWTLTEHDLLAALREAANDGDPDLILLTLEANSRTETYGDDDDE